jgi:hypothetical protein
MTLHQFIRSPRAVTLGVSVAIAFAAAPIASQEPARKVVPLVAAASLEPLLPSTLDGWTKVRQSSNRVAAADSCAWAFAEAVYVNGDHKLRVTIADTGFDSDALMILATIVRSFPDGHTETIPPDTVITRITYADSPGATLLNTSKREAEFTVVVGDRFVVKVEGTLVDGIDTLKAVLDRIDVKKVGELGK